MAIANLHKLKGKGIDFKIPPQINDYDIIKLLLTPGIYERTKEHVNNKLESTKTTEIVSNRKICKKCKEEKATFLFEEDSDKCKSCSNSYD